MLTLTIMLLFAIIAELKCVLPLFSVHPQEKQKRRRNQIESGSVFGNANEAITIIIELVSNN